MGVIEDVRKVVQDLVTPDLKAQGVQMESIEASSSLKFDALSKKTDASFAALSEKMEAKFNALVEQIEARFKNSSHDTDERFIAVLDKLATLTELMNVNHRVLSAKIDSNHATVIYTLNIDKRLDALERDRHSETASAAS